MAVYERSYGAYNGEVTPQNSRFLVLPRYAFRDVFQSKLFVAFLVLCFIVPLVVAGWIYLPHNSAVLRLIEAVSGNPDLIRFQPQNYFHAFMVPQSFLAFLLVLIVGPALISADMRNNAMPLYLARPFSRTDYVLGKACVLVFLLSAITWIPGLLLFGLQSYLEGWAWFGRNWFTGVALFVGSWIWIILLCVISLALSAYMRWKPLARLVLFGMFLVLAVMSGMINMFFNTRWGSLINISNMLARIWEQLFGISGASADSVPVWAAWLSLLTFCTACLALLMRRIKAYEIEK